MSLQNLIQHQSMVLSDANAQDLSLQLKVDVLIMSESDIHM